MGNVKEANFRIVRYNGEYRVEVEDKPIGWWYIVESKIKEPNEAFNRCKKYDDKIKPMLTVDDIKRILAIISEIMLDEANYKNDNFTMNKEEYYDLILKRFNNE